MGGMTIKRISACIRALPCARAFNTVFRAAAMHIAWQGRS